MSLLTSLEKEKISHFLDKDLVFEEMFKWLNCSLVLLKESYVGRYVWIKKSNSKTLKILKSIQISVFVFAFQKFKKLQMQLYFI